MQNPYIPNSARVEKIIEETYDVKTFRLVFPDENIRKNFNYLPGQFVEFSVYGVGEAPFCLASAPVTSEYIECSIKKMGKVTQAIHNLEAGDIVGIRGPYGNGFPVKQLKSKNLLFIAGGIGLAPLRSLINYCLSNRNDYKKIVILNGARTSKDLVYQSEYEIWKKSQNTELHLTIDCQEESWQCMVGVVPKVLEQINPSCEDAVSIVCGPPVMIRYTIPVLTKLGFCDENIISTLERHMQCGIGKCGHCMIGSKYVCKDGPVFTYAQIKDFPEEL
ncbi:MAG: FAD/NAD(P)-binding protein [Elusimicrobiota bacterium]